MRSLLVSIAMIVLVASCSEEKAGNHTKYSDPWRENFAGEPATLELLNFRVDSAGKLIPDSPARESGEWKDDYLRTYKEYDGSGNLVTTALYTYHPNGKPHLLTIEKNGHIFEKYETLLDKNGRDSITSFYDSTGKLSSYFTDVKEDPEGFMLAASVYSADSSLQNRITAEYDRRTLIKTVITDSTGKITRRHSAKLDERGDKTLDTWVDFKPGSTDTTSTKFRYENYDHQKNWLQKTEMDATGKPVKVVKRTIVYAKNED